MHLPRQKTLPSTRSENTVSTLSSTASSQENEHVYVYSVDDPPLSTPALSVHVPEIAGATSPLRMTSQLSSDTSLKEFSDDCDDNSDDVSIFKTMRQSTQRFQQSNENICSNRSSIFSKSSPRPSSPNFAQAPISQIGQNLSNFRSGCEVKTPITRTSNLKRFFSDPNVFDSTEKYVDQDKTPRRKNTSHRRSFSFWDVFNCGME